MTTSPLTRTRAYAPIEGRQQADDRLVSSALELRTMLEEAANAGAPLHVRLACDLEVDEPITIPTAVSAFTLNGGRIHDVVYTANLASVFRFEHATSPVLLVDAGFHGNGTTTAAVLVTSTGGTKNNVRMQGLDILHTTDLIDPAVTWRFCDFIDLDFNNDASAALANIRTTSGVASVSDSRFVNVAGLFNFIGSDSSGGNTLLGVGGATSTYDTSANVSGASGNVVSGGDFITVASAISDVFLGGPTGTGLQTRTPVFATTPRDQVLAGVNPTITVGAASFLRIDPGLSAGNSSIADGAAPGQQLTLMIVSGTITLPDNTANNVRLSAAWTPGAFDTLDLIWDAADGNWIERARSNN